VQIRGSIPLFWNQNVNLKYKPKIAFDKTSEQALPFTKLHFDQLVATYGPQVAINLIDQKGSEAELSKQFDNQIKALSNPKVTYEAFDFHTKCKGMKYENIGELVRKIDGDLKAHGFFFSRNGTVIRNQDGTTRTNCMDNLDRTNVVQSSIALHVLHATLSEFEGQETTNVDEFKKQFHSNEPFSTVFRNVWANNADAIANQYTGTNALKNDFTRTGQRSLKGTLNDGLNSCIRYWLNNFKDGFRQDGFDLALGNYRVDKSKSPFRATGLKMEFILSVLLALVLLSLFAVAIGLSPFPLYLWIIIWIVVIGALAHTFLKAGTQWVDKPRLVLKH